MPFLDELVRAYRSQGFELMSGRSALLHGGYFRSPFTWLTEDGESVTSGAGIALDEAHFVTDVGRTQPASRIFVVGNSFGWSTLVLALANPGSRVVAIDACIEELGTRGVALTNTLAAKLSLDVLVIEASSPGDTKRVIECELGGQFDLAFIDAYHTSEHLVEDWAALAPFANDRATAIFHDVGLFGMHQGFDTICTAHPEWQGTFLECTSSGMAAITRGATDGLKDLLSAYAGNPDVIDFLDRLQADESRID